MQEIPPCVVSNFTSFTSSHNPDSAENSENTFGCFSRDGTWSWVAHGAVLEVFSVQTKERCAAYCFGAKCKNSSLSITAIEELNSSHIAFPCLLVGLDTLCDGGLLCIVNVKTSKVISAIQLPYKVTSLEIVSSVGGAVMETFVLNNQLRYMFGIAAVGTEGGNVFLVDLCLDGENYNDETMPSKAAIVSKSVHSLPSKREVATANDQHICVFLNDNNFSCDTFEYRNGNTILANFPPGDVIVSALKYIRNIAVLVVGFNFGGIQLWNLQHLLLEISIPIHASQQPLVHFAFQEPENDPRNFCYLWSVRGHYQGENYRPENASIATLYALAYSKREWLARYGYFYQGLQSCTKRFEYALTSDPYNPAMNFSSHCSRLITCDVISQADLLSRLEIEDPLQNEEWSSAEDLGLCLMAWENWPTTGKKPSSSYLALFDINQWYQAQMPSLLRCNYGEMCSYFGVFSLKEVSMKMDLFSILAVSLVPSSLSRFKSSSMAEETFFPSSLSFKIWCMSTHGILQATYLGLQRQLLSEMNKVGPNILIDPKELYNRCLSSGLLNHLIIASPAKKTTLARQRETLLTLALEHSMIQFLVACVQSWKHMEFIHTGCSTKFMLDWVWKIVTQIKTSIDQLCLPLFDCSGQSFSENSLITLHIFKSRLKYLSDVIGAFQNFAFPQTELGQQELQLRREVVNYISVYLNVLLWLHDCKLLPEHPEGKEYKEDKVAFPANVLSRSYSQRRAELERLNCSISGSDMLLIDGLVEEFGDSLGNMWEQKGGLRMFPPPSIYAALSSYLMEKVSLPQKHILMYYVLLDIAAYLADRQSHLLEKLLTFCTSNDVSPSLSKLTQAFWHLDHQDFESAMNILVDPVVLTSDISAWQHTRIITSFLHQGHPQKALKYINIRSPPQNSKEAVKLHLSVLIANGLIGEAFFYLRQHQSSSHFEELLSHVFFDCQQTHSLDSLLCLPLTLPESSALAGYLHACNDPKAPELLVMSHLLRCQPLEASSLNEKLAQVVERSSKYKERAVARDALVSGFVDALPEEQKKLSKELAQVFHCLAHTKAQASIPQPLSASITSQSLTSMSYADLLKNVIGKVANSMGSSNTNTPFRSSISSAPFIRPAITPNGRKRKISTGYGTSYLKSPSKEARNDEYSTPSKRPRTFDIRSFLLSDKKPTPLKTPLHESLASLLHTPPVSRVASAQASKTARHSASHTTPLSILKTKISTQGPFSPSAQGHLYCKTPSVCSELSRDEQQSEDETEPRKRTEDMHPRQLRFQEPSPIKPERSSCVSPRRPIHEEEIVSAEVPAAVPSEDLEQVTSAPASTAFDKDPVLEPQPPSHFSSVEEMSVAPVLHNEKNFPVYNVDYDSPIEIDSSESSSSNLEVVFDSRTATANNCQAVVRDDNENADVPFLNAAEENDGNSNLIVADLCLMECASSSYQIYIPDADLNGAGFSNAFIPQQVAVEEISMTCSDGDDIETRSNHSGCTTPENIEMNHSGCTTPEKIEMAHSGCTTPEVREDSQSSSPYMFTRSRSKSVSPSRTPSKDTVSAVIPKSVALFTAADHNQMIKEFPENEGGIPLLEAELPHPGTLSPSREVLHETPRVRQSRSRSKSSSPSRNFVPKSKSVLEPSSVKPFTAPEIEPISSDSEDSDVQIVPAHEASLFAPAAPIEGKISEDPCIVTVTESSPVIAAVGNSETSETEASSIPHEGSESESREKDHGMDCNTVVEPVTSQEKLLEPETQVEVNQPTASSLSIEPKSPSHKKQGSVSESDEREQHMDCNNAVQEPVSSEEKLEQKLVEPELHVKLDQPIASSHSLQPKSPRKKRGSRSKSRERKQNIDCDKAVEEPVLPQNKLLEAESQVEANQPTASSLSLEPKSSLKKQVLSKKVTQSSQRTETNLFSSELTKAEEKNETPDHKPKSGKKRRKAKPAEFEKIEFTFSDPHAPADSEVLQALSSTSSPSTARFVFSPPASRTRNRQKKLTEMLSSSVLLDSSRILNEGDNEKEGAEHKIGSSYVNVSSRPKNSSSKVKRKSKSSIIASPQNFINLISPIASASSTPEKQNKPLSSTRHSMTLRKAKKSVKLF